MAVVERVTRWKNKLLDLGKRNRLLFFKPTRRTTLRLVEPSFGEIFQRLVNEERAFEFPQPKPGIVEHDPPPEVADAPAEPAPKVILKPGQVLADQCGSELEKSLYQLRQKAKSALEEQGVNILYIAFGYLEWSEAEASRDIIRSPLLLVPVELQQESILDPYELVPVDDDLILNPTLIHKLNQDFGVSLPELPAEDDWNLDDLLNQIEQRVAKRGWRVVREAYLSLFSFLKLNMYKDLDRHAGEMAEHPLISALAGDPSKMPPLAEELITGVDLDRKIRPHETYQVVDADSSQQEAILAAKRGDSFVLQGPPGTGKSQTITNIIAECLAAGKRVLFVSEKMAALGVVHRRLADSGLADFCLPLHSHNANKKEVVDELGRTLLADRTQVTAGALEQLESLAGQRERLNGFVEALHTVREPLKRSAYQVHGEVARLEAAPDVTVSFDRVGERTPADLHRYAVLLEQLALTARRAGADYFSNPWTGCSAPAYTHELQQDITARFGRLHGLIEELLQRLAAPVGDLGLAPADSLREMAALAEILALAGDSPQPPAEWLLSETLEPLLQKAGAYQEAQAEYQSLRSGLLQRYQEAVLALETGPLAEALTRGSEEAIRPFQPAYLSHPDRLIQERDQLLPFLQQVERSIAGLLQEGGALAGMLEVQPPQTLADCRRLAGLAGQVARDPQPAAHWFDPTQYWGVIPLVQEARNTFERLAGAESTLFAAFDREVLAQGIPQMLQRFRTDYAGLFRLFKPGFHRDLKSLRSHSKRPDGLSYQQALDDLQLMKRVLEHRAWVTEHEGALMATLGEWYRGGQTDWTGLDSSLTAVGAIAAHFRPEAPPAALQQVLIRSGAPIRQVAVGLEKLAASLATVTTLLETVRTRAALASDAATPDQMGEMALAEIRTWATSASQALEPFCTAYDRLADQAIRRDALPIQQVRADLAAVKRVQEIEADIQTHLTELKSTFGRFYQGVETEWPALFTALDWAGKLLARFAPGRPPAEFARLICTDPEAAKLAHDTAIACGPLLEMAARESDYVCSLFEPNRVDVSRISSAAARDWLQLRLHNLAALEDWIDFRQSREQCAAEGLGPFVDAVLQSRIPPDAIKPAFFKRFYRLWLDDQYAKAPALQMFRGRQHEEQIRAFRQLDRTQFRIAQSRLRARLSEQRPNPHIMAARGSEVATLLRETEKRRRLKPLRKLFEEIPNLLMTLKPCLLMSPLSVSQYLDPHRYTFDTVIFDEASQICSEDAIGAVFRGQQVIVVGDREQLPPTNFFGASVGDGAFDDEEEDVEAYESILDECGGVLHRKTLRWHYRSRHEHLIAFSNAQIYKNLVTFPSPSGRVQGQGVEFVPVTDGIYDRSGSRANKIEAQRVAEMVFGHFTEYPNRSLGIVTFSEAQQSAVDAAIRQMRIEQPEMEPFFRDDRPEPFFIKNLENVQGDERDTIIFSIGYARDQAGVMHMNFGPLSREGGYRRLNVAITRAKQNVKVVSSIKPTDIDLTRTEARGVQMLRLYMEYAIHGPEALSRELQVTGAPAFDSPFEEAVYGELVRLGYQVDTQVGCSGYRLDLAIRHPELSGRYLLGVECDGSSYHSAKTARDRDRLREDVLRGLGWRIHRIWSADWVKDPRAEISRLAAAVEEAKAACQEDLPAAPAAEVQAAATPPLEVAVSPEKEAEALAMLPGTREYVEADIWSVGTTPGQSDAERAAAVLAHVIAQEGPIHLELLARRVAPFWGRDRVGPQLKRDIERVLEQSGQGRWTQRKSFLWPTGMEAAPVRVPAGGERARTIGQICPEELAEAAMLVLQRAVGMSLEDLVAETARLLGFSRTGDQIREAVLEAVSLLEGAQRVELRDGVVRPVRSPGGA